MTAVHYSFPKTCCLPKILDYHIEKTDEIFKDMYLFLFEGKIKVNDSVGQGMYVVKSN